MSILNLPIAEQEKIAQMEGLSHSAWVKQAKETLERTRKFSESILAYEKSLTPEQKEQALRRSRRLQERMDAEVPPE